MGAGRGHIAWVQPQQSQQVCMQRSRKKPMQQIVFDPPQATPQDTPQATPPVATPSPETPRGSPPFIPLSWSSAYTPRPHCPSPVLVPGILQPKTPRMTSTIVASVLDKCKTIDPGAELASATFTQENETMVRVRTSITCSIVALQSAIDSVMPLCGVEVVDSPLDGTTEIGIIVPTKERELRAARNLIRKRLVPRLLGHVGLLCFVFGLSAWVVSTVESLGQTDAREL